MPRRLATALIAIGALASLWVSSASGVVVYIPITNVQIFVGPWVIPKRLPRVEAAPIALSLDGRIKTRNGSQPPALQELVLDLDRHISIDARGIPVCKRSQRDLRFPVLKSQCKDAIVGKGKLGLQIQFPEQPPVSSESELIVVNGGRRTTGEATLYAVANLTQPITTSLVMTIEITKRPEGNRMVIKVPALANGAGSLTFLRANLRKRFARNGKAVDFLTGRCPDGKLQSHFNALFADGTALGVDALQTCVPGD